ncbi:hypothetical protein [Actinobacillus equuli]|uniref:hypothetical protein n=1 Tax=Actinobacillus equuli TaxID=718 RepID=UPI002442756F|nr:hypothetical protein [Actinobacillus equuli]WGE50995.1 hypothetical protein NYR68_00975 [Actinobacillus equuli subsp. haemolyticus]WGE59361.1 hypothetical protein NYR73_00940 [Actinobacillus equuli subsp. haemolyticus]WGE61996.1 hypothetical protein NYR74_04530 [Actinobacillus equuli subsp. haemolyticus]WGE69551.1 hypothetical protein NYR78_00945 [Actinobacillus equuli subsp. haemolyticus]WGE71144.1 hypothetical protein NYR79_09885 [Actinobacillus equuli subsp. haemolyticus]
MSHNHDSEKKYDIATHALLPMVLMLFVQMLLNHYFAPQNAIFISPYLLAFFVANLIAFFVLWKGEICPGQTGRLLFVLKFFIVFALGNFVYSIGFTPKHNPMALAGVASLMLGIFYWLFNAHEKPMNTLIYCAFGILAVGMIQYLAIYWVELPSLFNGVRANNFAQLLFGILLAGWYLMLAKSRLDVFFKLLVQLALIVLVLNYLWSAFVLYQQLQIMPGMSLLPYVVYFLVQFVIFALLAWLLLGKGEKQIKNPLGWTLATLLAMLYPFTNMI